MNPDDFAALLLKLPELSPKQKHEVAGKLQALAQAAPLDLDEGPRLSDDWLLAGICAALKAKGLMSDLSARKITRTVGFKVYAKLAPGLRADLERLLPARSRAQGRSALAFLVGTSLIGWCDQHPRFRSMNAPSFLLQNTLYVWEAIERAFPGYLGANLLHIVIQPRKS